MEETKACSKCGEVKPLSEFTRVSRNKSGYGARCLVCEREKNRAYIQSGKKSRHIAKDPVRWKLQKLAKDSRCRAKKAGIDHDLDLNYLLEILPKCCPYLGTKFYWEVSTGFGRQNPHPRSPSIDRIDSSKGYVKDNVAIVSHRANAIKNNATEQELFRIGRALSLLKAEMAFPE